MSLAVLSLMIATSTTTGLSARELEARLAFLEDSLEDPELHADVWWWGWLSFYSAGAVAQGVRIGFVDGEADDAGAQRADLAISMIKAIGGAVSMLVQPLNAMSGARAMQAIEGTTHADDLLRLEAGEDALAENALESERTYWWLRHSLLVAVNAAHFFIMWLGYDDPEKGAISASVGIAIGELAIWTQPWQPRGRYEEYRAMVGRP